MKKEPAKKVYRVVGGEMEKFAVVAEDGYSYSFRANKLKRLNGPKLEYFSSEADAWLDYLAGRKVGLSKAVSQLEEDTAWVAQCVAEVERVEEILSEI